MSAASRSSKRETRQFLAFLTDHLGGAPRLADVALLKRILGNHGVDCMILGKRAGHNGPVA